MATLSKHRITAAMPTATTADAWPPERIDRLARAMYPLIFGRPAPAPATTNVVMLADYRRLALPR